MILPLLQKKEEALGGGRASSTPQTPLSSEDILSDLNFKGNMSTMQSAPLGITPFLIWIIHIFTV